MTRKTILSIVVVLVTVLTACGGATPTAAPPKPEGATTRQKGGEIAVVYKADLATLDPAIGYGWTNWPTIKMVFDGLLDYDSGTTIQPRIAESLPTVSDDGLTY